MREAFTMIELVLVIVVLGVISAMAIPRIQDDLRQETVDSIYAGLQLTRHMALIDNRTDPSNPNWQQELWHIHFAKAHSSAQGADKGYFFTVSSNLNHGANVNKVECAIDPTNGKYMYNRNGDDKIDIDETPSIFLSQNYGVADIKMSGGCGPSTYIAFDHLGRPYKGGIYVKKDLFGQIMLTDCRLEIGFENDDIENIIFNIQKETGHISIE